MGVHTTESVVVPADAATTFPHVADLDRYPAWMRLVHRADRIAGDDTAAWDVEIRARVGPFARSKRLRMERTRLDPDTAVEFQRAETDGRSHARWRLAVELSAADEGATLVTMHLDYDGALWTGGLLDRVLDDEIRRGRSGLAALVSGEPTR